MIQNFNVGGLHESANFHACLLVVQAVVVREGTQGGNVGTQSADVLAFGLLLPQQESLQVLYIGMRYDSPLVRQSSCYFKVRLLQGSA